MFWLIFKIHLFLLTLQSSSHAFSFFCLLFLFIVSPKNYFWSLRCNSTFINATIYLCIHLSVFNFNPTVIYPIIIMENYRVSCCWYKCGCLQTSRNSMSNEPLLPALEWPWDFMEIAMRNEMHVGRCSHSDAKLRNSAKRPSKSSRRRECVPLSSSNKRGELFDEAESSEKS